MSDTMMVNKILLATDFSASAISVIDDARSLCRIFGAELVLLHVVETLGLSLEHLGVIQDSAAIRQRAEDEVAVLISRRFEPIDRVTGLVRTGRAAKEIVDAAQDLNCDLILIGSHGHAGLARDLLGNTAEQVVRLADRAVLVLRSRE